MASRPLLLAPARPLSFQKTDDRAAPPVPIPIPLPSLAPARPPAEVPAPQPRTSRPAVRFVVRALVVALALGAPGLAFAGQKSVTVDIDGRVRNIRTYASDARTLLERTGVRVGADDLLRPKGAIRSGTRITLRRAKKITLLVDGKPARVTTHGLTVAEGLAGLGLRPGAKDFVYPPAPARLDRGMSVSVRNAIRTKVRVDGRLRDVVSAGATVAELLRQADITVGPNDYVIPDPNGKPVDGMWIRVVRVRRTISETRRAVPFGVVTRRDSRLASGVRRVVQSGAQGLELHRTLVVTEDGTEVRRAVLSVKTVRPAQDRIIRIGTREPRFRGSGQSQSGLASWYRSDGLVAAHPSLPMGTVVRVTNKANGRSVDVRINDRGPFVEGRIIDLSDEAFERLAPLSEGTIDVRLTW